MMFRRTSWCLLPCWKGGTTAWQVIPDPDLDHTKEIPIPSRQCSYSCFNVTSTTAHSDLVDHLKPRALAGLYTAGTHRVRGHWNVGEWSSFLPLERVYPGIFRPLGHTALQSVVGSAAGIHADYQSNGVIGRQASWAQTHTLRKLSKECGP
uniref:Putative secreted protein n=1 Tax=Anopheles triannulatus TaxID=58253 RepID=A0A2M4B2U2_9DIPT